MKSIFSGIVCRILIASMIVLPWQAQAGLIGTDQALASAQQRAALVQFVSRADVADQLQRFGISSKAANERVAALSDAEVADLAGRIDAQPAGASVPWGILFAIIIVFYLAIWVPYYSDKATASTKGKTAPPPAEKK